MITLKAEGYKELSEGECGVQWSLFTGVPSDISIDDLEDELLGQLGWGRWYSGPGRGFGHTPTVRRQGSRALVKQVVGLDV